MIQCDGDNNVNEGVFISPDFFKELPSEVMGSIEINFEKKTLGDSQKNLQKGVGNIWITVGGKALPEERWSDFVYWILSSWSRTLIELMRARKRREKMFDFFDGNFGFRLKHKAGQIYVLEFGAWDRFDDTLEVDFAHEIVIDDFANELMRVNNEIISHLAPYNVDSQYFEEVRTWSEKLIACRAAMTRGRK